MYDSTQTTMVLVDVSAERRRQATDLGWTQEHDDSHDLKEFVDLAGDQIAKASRALTNTEHREHMIKAIALLVAQVEVLDRRAGR